MSRRSGVKVKCSWCGKEKTLHRNFDYNGNPRKEFFCDGKCRGKYQTHIRPSSGRKRELVMKVNGDYSWNINLVKE